jgi:hypothetical protein
MSRNDLLPVPTLDLMTRVECAVSPIVSLGEGEGGRERRFVPLGEGRVHGPVLNGRLIAGGVDWQWREPDGHLQISAHYAMRLDDGAVVEVRSEGVRDGPPEVLAALARGEAVPPAAYYFRTFVRFATGAPAWSHLNRRLALAVGGREASRVLLDLYRVG